MSPTQMQPDAPSLVANPDARDLATTAHARTESSRLYDVVIIGGGAVGLATAMALLEGTPRPSLVVLEAENALARHQTGNNSGVIHSGLYYRPDSLKARLCQEGREALYRFCAERGIPHEPCGKIVVATTAEELPALEMLRQRGIANRLSGMQFLPIEQLREREPHVAGVAGLYVGETGIVDYRAVIVAYAQLIRERGGEIHLGCRVAGATVRPTELITHTTRGDVHGRAVINCAGLQCDRVARLFGVNPLIQIVPFRGEYYRLAPAAHGLVRNLIYPVPNPAFPFLGVHFTRMVGGGVEAGPNAVLALSRHGYSWRDVSLEDLGETLAFPGFWRLARRYWDVGLSEVGRSVSRTAFLEALRRLMPDLRPADLLPGGAGVRAQAMEPTGALSDDFRIQAAPRMVHVLNAPSPAATASISIGRHIASLARRAFGW